MEDLHIELERHEQIIKNIEKDLTDIKGMQSEIRSMNETLAIFATELKYTNEHLKKHEERLELIESKPANRLNTIFNAIIAAIIGGIIAVLIEKLIK